MSIIDSSSTAVRTIAGVEDVYPLSAMQQGMMFNSLYAPGSGAEVEQLVIDLREPVDGDALARAWQRAVGRHPVLRTTFRWEGVAAPVQVVHRELWAAMPEHDWRSIPADEQRRRLDAWLRADRLRGFDLAEGPLMRLALFHRADVDSTLVWTFHHAVLDARAMALVLREVFADYDGDGKPHGALRPFRDYVAWFQEQDHAASEPFWRALLAGCDTPTPLPLARGGAPCETEEHLQRSARLPLEATAALASRAAEHGLTLNSFVQAAWGILLARYSGRDDVVFGTTRACRRSAAGGAEGIVGPVFNSIPVRLRTAGGATLLECAEALRAQSLEVRANEHTPLQLVQEWCGARGAPLFETLAAFENRNLTGMLRAQEAPWRSREVHILRKSNFPLTLSAYGEPELLLTVTYAPSRFEPGEIDRLLRQLRRILEECAARPHSRAGEVDLLDEAERDRLLVRWNDTAAPVPGAPVHLLIAEQAARAPGAPAVLCGEGVLSYAELDAGADRVARRLRRLGVGAEARVAVCLERSGELVVALLGVMRAGAAYVPLDPEHPDERLAYMCRDAGAAALITRGSLLDPRPALAAAAPCVVEVPGPDGGEAPEGPLPAVGMEQLAYVVYTSGSTGQPKGVCVSHRGLANLGSWHGEAFSLAPGVRTSWVAGLGFDASVWELWPSLAAGATLCIPPGEIRADPPRLREWMLAQRLAVAFLPTPLAAEVLQLPWPAEAPLRVLLTGGDRLSRPVAAGLPFRVVNNYGPTECTVLATSGTVAAGDADGRAPSIGRPVANTRVYLLDDGLEPVPAGAVGELCIAGAGVARGYLGRPALTAERFVPDPHGPPGSRLYRTGDLARHRPDGSLDFVGRTDGQVKVHGVRVELGEVEAVLARHPAVKAAAAAVRGARLVGYVVPREAGGAPAAAALRELLRARLPGAMVPAAFVTLAALPLTPNGKLDRAALPDPLPGSAAEDAAPRTPLEEILAGIWAEVLGVERVDTGDDFFAMGGNSLAATRVVSHVRELLAVELPLRALFEAPTPASLAVRVEASHAGRDAAPPVTPVARTGPLPLSFAQERLWFLDQLEPGGTAYVIPVAWRLTGPLGVAALEHALDALVSRHESLRTVLRADGALPRQVVLAAEPVKLAVEELPAGDAEAALRGRMREEEARPFSLSRGPLFRARLFRLGDARHVLLLTIHHAVFDGWSLGVIGRELSALYSGALGRPAASLGPVPLQYGDYAVWQRGQLSGAVLEEQLAYWRARLAGAPERLELPTDHPRPAVLGSRGAREAELLPPELVERLRALARAEGATLYMVLLAAFQLLLGRYAGTEDVVVGSPVAGRTRRELEGVVGLFVNTLALRADLSGAPTFRELLRRVREATLEAYAHQELPFERLVEELRPERSLGHAPVFQVLFALQNAGDGSLELDGLQVEPVAREGGTAKLDLVLAAVERGGGLSCTAEYARDLWDPPTVRRMLGHFRRVLESAAEEPARPIASIALLSDAERVEAVEGWNATAAEYPGEATVHSLFERWAAAAPDAPAVACGAERLTYGELNARANRLARCLRGLCPGAEPRIGVCIERSADLVVALLAVAKAGGAYLPLDPAYPAERLAYMVADAAVSAVVVADGLPGALASFAGPVVSLRHDRDALAAHDGGNLEGVPAFADSLVNVIYTSGSTGRPKGSGIPHRGVVRLVRGTDYVRLGPDDRVAQLSSTSFDALSFELWGALLNGGCLVVFDRETLLAPRALAAALRAERITAALLTTALFREAAREVPGGFAGMRTLLTGGEAADPAAFRRVLSAGGPRRLVNAYGPTECSTVATWHPVAEVPEGTASIPIGLPIRNTTAYVLDAAMEPCPVGVPGELHLGGPGLARGYLGRPALTAERFVPHPFAAGERLYRTGDLVRRRADGAIEFVGRMDHQVKIRGFRIEPGEVESAVLRVPGVESGAVLVREDAPGDRRLVAYVVPAAGAALTGAEVRTALRKQLPEYMVPAATVVLDALPLTPNGKLDRRALPAPEWGGEEGSARVAPRTPAEERLAAVWREVLRLGEVGVHDDFFLAGGHSLLAAQVVSRAEEAFGVRLPLRAVFEHPTIAGLAAELEGASPPAPEPTLEPMSSGTAEELLGRIDELSEEEMDRLLASLPVEQDLV